MYLGTTGRKVEKIGHLAMNCVLLRFVPKRAVIYYSGEAEAEGIVVKSSVFLSYVTERQEVRACTDT